jgi:cytoskeletal protein RodZ
MGPQRTIGESIGQARRERGLSLEEVSRETRLSMVVLRNLETDHFAELPGGLYVENAIRILAEFLDLDRAALMARYRDGRTVNSADPAGELEPAVWSEEGVPETRVRAWRPGGRFLIIAALAILIGLLGLALGKGWLKLPEFGDKGGEAAVEQLQEPEEEPVTATPDPEIVDPPVTEERSPATETLVAKIEEPVSSYDGPLLPDGAVRETRLRRDAAMELLITATDDCRVQVNMDGRRHLARALSSGERWRLQAAYQLVINVDDGAAVLLELDGEPYSLPTEQLRGQTLALRIDPSR